MNTANPVRNNAVAAASKWTWRRNSSRLRIFLTSNAIKTRFAGTGRNAIRIRRLAAKPGCRNNQPTPTSIIVARQKVNRRAVQEACDVCLLPLESCTGYIMSCIHYIDKRKMIVCDKNLWSPNANRRSPCRQSVRSSSRRNGERRLRLDRNCKASPPWLSRRWRGGGRRRRAVPTTRRECDRRQSRWARRCSQ